MHIGATIHAELRRCSNTIGLLVEQHRLNHGMIITGNLYGPNTLLPQSQCCDASWRADALGFASVDGQRQALPALTCSQR